MTNSSTTQRIIFDCGSIKHTLMCVDDVSFRIQSRFCGTNKLSDLLLSVAKESMSKNPQNMNLAGSERGELWYNQSGN